MSAVALLPTPVQTELFETVAVSVICSDVTGDDYCSRVPAEVRRAEGITFTPHWLVERMLDQTASSGPFDTVIDPGAGSGRFALAAARRFPGAKVIAVELNAGLATTLRAHVRHQGLGSRIEVIHGDFRDTPLPLRGRALFIGNPPYVRHHDLSPEWKRWYAHGMAERGVPASQLAGLHAHFMLRLAQLLRPGDVWSLVTAAEWLDNGYGSAIRHLMSQPRGLGLTSLWLAASDEAVFPDALVSAVVTQGLSAVQPVTEVTLGQVRAAGSSVSRSVPINTLCSSQRWSPLCQPGALQVAQGIELGELFRVTRGQVTGMNEAWVLSADAPETWRALSVPAVTRAREIIDGSVTAMQARTQLNRVIDLPRDLDALATEHKIVAQGLIERAKRMGADEGYVARQRKPWFAVGMREPPMAFVSYMGRRPPVFQPNPRQLSYLNIAHGLYARQPMCAEQLDRVLGHLNTSTDLYAGRVYGGGLAKFEPSDIARLRVPPSVWGAAV